MSWSLFDFLIYPWYKKFIKSKEVGDWEMGIYRSEIADLRKNIGENIGQKIIIKESPG